MKRIQSIFILISILFVTQFAFAEKDLGELLTKAATTTTQSNVGAFNDISQSFERFIHTWFIIKLFSGLLLSVLLAALVSNSPRSFSAKANWVMNKIERRMKIFWMRFIVGDL